MLALYPMVSEIDIMDANPWWSDAGAIHRNRKLVDLENAAIRYTPRLLGDIRYDYEPDNTVIYTLRGPRQVGKTTLLVLQIRDFLVGRKANPWNVFYYSFDDLRSRSDLAGVIKAYLRISGGMRDAASRTYMFLDEITAVPEWERSIKSLVDGARLENCTVLATGSRPSNVVGSARLLAGRRGRTGDPYDKALLPMSFAEFARLRNPDLDEFLRDHGFDAVERRRGIVEGLASGEIDDALKQLYARFWGAADDCLYGYMLAGGVPKIVDARARHGRIDKSLYASYWDLVKSDWRPIADDDLLVSLGRAIVRAAGNTSSWNGIRRSVDAGSWSSVREHTMRLKDLLLLAVVYRYNETSRAPMAHKDKKIYVRDPFYAHLLRRGYGAGDPFRESVAVLEDESEQGRIVESIVADHLLRLSFSLSANPQMFSPADHVLYWKDEKGREVDFVLRGVGGGGDLDIPIEVKYTQSLRPRELGGMRSFEIKTGTRTGIVVTKGALREARSYVAVPAGIFLLLA